MPKYKTEISSIHFDDQSISSKDGVIEGIFPEDIVSIFRLTLLDEQIELEDKSPATQVSTQKRNQNQKKQKVEAE